MPSKRYTVVNFYIRGSNVTPQVCHGLNRLWTNRSSMSEKALAVFDEWTHHSEVEIILQGVGGNKYVEDLYASLVQIKDIPSAQFHEGEDDLKGVCTVVTFIASERIVQGGDALRANRISPAGAVDFLSNYEIDAFGNILTASEIDVVVKTAFLSLVT